MSSQLLILQLLFTNIDTGDTITLPFNTNNGLTIDWGDLSIQDNNLTHTYIINEQTTQSGFGAELDPEASPSPSPSASPSDSPSASETTVPVKKVYSFMVNVYTIITDVPNMYNFGTTNPNGWDLGKLKSVSQWTTKHFNSFSYAFNNCTLLTTVPNYLSITITNLSGMFKNCLSFNSPIRLWDVSKVTNMADMFNSATSFNQPIDTWNVSNVTNMSGMFNNATSFNQPIGTWNISKVTDMSRMFKSSGFDQDISKWALTNKIKSFDEFMSFSRMSTRNFEKLMDSIVDKFVPKKGGSKSKDDDDDDKNSTTPLSVSYPQPIKFGADGIEVHQKYTPGTTGINYIDLARNGWGTKNGVRSANNPDGEYINGILATQANIFIIGLKSISLPPVPPQPPQPPQQKKVESNPIVRIISKIIPEPKKKEPEPKKKEPIIVSKVNNEQIVAKIEEERAAIPLPSAPSVTSAPPVIQPVITATFPPKNNTVLIILVTVLTVLVGSGGAIALLAYLYPKLFL